MDLLKLQQSLAGCNLTKLALLSGVSVRQLRRIKGGGIEPKLSTIDAIKANLKGAKL